MVGTNLGGPVRRRRRLEARHSTPDPSSYVLSLARLK